jgi:hypothetical protein
VKLAPCVFILSRFAGGLSVRFRPVSEEVTQGNVQGRQIAYFPHIFN